MKRFTTIGDLGEAPYVPAPVGQGDLKLAERDSYPGTPARLDSIPSGPAKPTPAAAPKPAAAPPPTWVLQGGEWFYKWRNVDTWAGLAQRYLGNMKRHPEIWAYQTDAFKKQIPSPVSIRTGSLVRMPPEAVDKARALGELDGRGAIVLAAPQAATPNAPQSSPIAPSAPSVPALAQQTPPTATLPSLPVQPAGGTSVRRPDYQPAAGVPNDVRHDESSGHVGYWIAGGLGVVALSAIGWFTYQATQDGTPRRGQ